MHGIGQSRAADMLISCWGHMPQVLALAHRRTQTLPLVDGLECDVYGLWEET